MKIKLQKNSLERYKSFSAVLDQEHNLSKQLCVDFTSNDPLLIRHAVMFTLYRCTEEQYFEVFKDVSKKLSDDLKLNSLFWEAITFEIEDVTHLGSKIPIYMHLLGQVSDESLSKIPNIKQIQEHIDKVVTEDISKWLKHIQQSRYLSSVIFNALIVISEEILSKDHFTRLDLENLDDIFSTLVLVDKSKAVQLFEFNMALLERQEQIQLIGLKFLPRVMKLLDALEGVDVLLAKGFNKLLQVAEGSYGELYSTRHETIIQIAKAGLAEKIYDYIVGLSEDRARVFDLEKILIAMPPAGACKRIKLLLEASKWYPALEVVSKIVDESVAEEAFESVIAIWDKYESVKGMGRVYNIEGILTHIILKMKPNIAFTKLELLLSDSRVHFSGMKSIEELVEKDPELGQRALEFLMARMSGEEDFRISNYGSRVEGAEGAFTKILLKIPEGFHKLKIYIADQNLNVRRAAAQAMSEIVKKLPKHEALEFLNSLLKTEEPNFLQSVRDKFLKLSDSMMTSEVAKFNKFFAEEGKNDQVQRQAVKALAEMSSEMTIEEASNYFKPLLSHLDYQIKTDTVSVLASKVLDVSLDEAFNYLRSIMISKDTAISNKVYEEFTNILMTKPTSTAVAFIKKKMTEDKQVSLLGSLPNIILQNGFEVFLVYENQEVPTELESGKIYFYLFNPQGENFYQKSLYYKIKGVAEEGVEILDKPHVTDTLRAVLLSNRSGFSPEDVRLVKLGFKNDISGLLKILYDNGHLHVNMDLARQAFSMIKADSANHIWIMLRLVEVSPELSKDAWPYFKNVLKKQDGHIILRYISLLDKMVEAAPELSTEAWVQVKTIIDRVISNGYGNCNKELFTPIPVIVSAAAHLSVDVFNTIKPILDRISSQNQRHDRNFLLHFEAESGTIAILKVIPCLIQNLPHLRDELVLYLKSLFITNHEDSLELFYLATKVIAINELIDQFKSLLHYVLVDKHDRKSAVKLILDIVNSLQKSDVPKFLAQVMTHDNPNCGNQVRELVSLIICNIIENNTDLAEDTFKALNANLDSTTSYGHYFAFGLHDTTDVMSKIAKFLPLDVLVTKIRQLTASNVSARVRYDHTFQRHSDDEMRAVLNGFTLALEMIEGSVAMVYVREFLNDSNLSLQKLAIEALAVVAAKSDQLARESWGLIKPLLESHDTVRIKLLLPISTKILSKLPAKEAMRKLKFFFEDPRKEFKDAAMKAIPSLIDANPDSASKILKQVKTFLNNESDTTILPIIKALFVANRSLVATEFEYINHFLNSDNNQMRYEGWMILKIIFDAEIKSQLLSDRQLVELMTKIELYILALEKEVKLYIKPSLDNVAIDPFGHDDYDYLSERAQLLESKITNYKSLIRCLQEIASILCQKSDDSFLEFLSSLSISEEGMIARYLSVKICHKLFSKMMSEEEISDIALNFLEQYARNITFDNMQYIIIFDGVNYKISNTFFIILREKISQVYAPEQFEVMEFINLDALYQEIERQEMQLIELDPKPSREELIIQKSYEISKEVVTRLKLVGISASDDLEKRFIQDLARNLRENRYLLDKSLENEDYSGKLITDIVSALYKIDSTSLSSNFLIDTDFFSNILTAAFETISFNDVITGFAMKLVGVAPEVQGDFE